MRFTSSCNAHTISVSRVSCHSQHTQVMSICNPFSNQVSYRGLLERPYLCMYVLCLYSSTMFKKSVRVCREQNIHEYTCCVSVLRSYSVCDMARLTPYCFGSQSSDIFCRWIGYEEISELLPPQLDSLIHCL